MKELKINNNERGTGMKIPKVETRLEVKNEADSDIAELYLYGTIREAYWWDDEDDCISAKRVRNALKELKGKDINVHLNSPGGDVFESIAICNLFKQHDADINIIVDSLAGSGASIITTAGKKVTMFTNSMQMIHKAWTYTQGNADDLRKAADDLDKIDSSVKASYKARFVGTDEELDSLIKDESWLTAEECKTFGFCDEILDDAKKDEPENEPKASVKETLFNKYKKNILTEVDKKSTLFNLKPKGEIK